MNDGTIVIAYLSLWNNWINETFMDFTVINKFSIGENSHPLEEAHEAWANYLYNYIITNNILNKK